MIFFNTHEIVLDNIEESTAQQVHPFETHVIWYGFYY